MSWNEFTRDQKLVTVFTVLTALMHLAFAPTWTDDDAFGMNLALLFVINGIGYFAFLYLLYFDKSINLSKNVATGILTAWTIATIVGWLLQHPGDTLLDSSIMNKVMEVLLLVFLYLDYTAEESVTAE